MVQPSSSIPALDPALSRHTPQPTTFQHLAILTTVFAYTQIVLGAIVRVSGSGLGCGDDWPLCRGHILPPLNAQAIVEYAHRTVGSLTGVLLMVTMVVGWLTFRHSQPLLLRLIVAAAGMIVLEGLLGALVVFKNLASVLVLTHLAVALALIGLLLTATILALPGSRLPAERSVPQLTLAALVLTYALLLTGAGVVATGADEVCRSWPLCGGGLQPSLGGLALYTTFHRLAAGLIGFFLLLTLSMVLRQRRSAPWQRTCARVTLVLLLIQIGSGYLTATDHTLSFIAAFHVAIATAIWCGIVVTTVLAHRPDTPLPGDDGTTARTTV